MIHLTEFKGAIINLNKIKVTFRAKKYNNAIITRVTAPMDYALSKRYKDNIERYHFWDFEGSERQHNLSLLETEIVSIEVLDEKFEPSSFVAWETNWSIKRDWGSFS